jgi:hypothetical protein
MEDKVTNLRDAVSARMSRPITDEMWTYVVDMGFDDDAVAQSSDNVQFVIDEIKKVTTAVRSMDRPPGELLPDRPREAAASARIDALSAIYAAWANHDSDVRFFRNRVLVRRDTPAFLAYLKDDIPFPDYQLLTLDQVRPWIGAEHARVAPEGLSGDEHVVELIRHAPPDKPSPVVHLTYLADNHEQRLTVDKRSTLGELAKLADKLVNHYRWRPSEASTFVLTGRTPEVFVYTGSAQIRYGMDSSATTRVTMELDPFLTPDQVADIYGRLRSKLRPHPPRSLSVKHYRLAQHVGPHVQLYVDQPRHRQRSGRPPTAGPTGLAQYVDPVAEHTWQSLRQTWNETYGDHNENSRSWRYTHASNFIRDARTALERLLDPQWRMWEEQANPQA